jgi:hypothetical protein
MTRFFPLEISSLNLLPDSSAEKKLAEIGPCANTKTTFFNKRS